MASGDKVESIVKGIGSMIIASIVLIGLALVYFLVTAWIVDIGVDLATGSSPSADFTALSAAILTLGGLAGSTFRSIMSQPAPSQVEGSTVEVA